MNHPELRRYIRHGTLVQLSVFETVARLGSFTRAGMELHMAQPTVSMHVKKLTESIGLELLESKGKKISMTPAGQEVSASCQALFQQILEMEARLASLRTTGNRGLRLAVSTTAKYFAPHLLAHYWESHPGVEVALMPMNRQHLLNRLNADLDDFYILSEPPIDKEVLNHPLLVDRIGIYARHDHPLVTKRELSLSELAHEPFILREVGSGTRQTADAAMAKHGISPSVRMQLSSNEAVKQAMLSGIGISMLSELCVASEIRAGRLAALDVKGFPIERQWQLVYRRDRKLSPAAEGFLEQIRGHSQQNTDLSQVLVST